MLPEQPSIQRRDPAEAMAMLGFDSYRPGQEAAIRSLLEEGRDALVILPTGGGKTMVAQVAGYALGGLTIVVSPLIALMGDQVRRMQAAGFDAVAINSSLDPNEGHEQIQRISKIQSPCFLFVSPERLANSLFVQQMELIKNNIRLLTIDEIHCCSQWGHDFRPDYLRISQFRKVIGLPLTLGMTATATQRVADEVVHFMDLRDPFRIVTGFDRPNIELKVIPRPQGTRWDFENRLEHFLQRSHVWSREMAETQNLPRGADMLYFSTVKNVEEAREWLAGDRRVRDNYTGLYQYHGQMQPADRREVEARFIQDERPLICATLAFGMGIDKPNVRTVCHVNIPGSLEAYYQEIGRAGRDGLPSQAILFYHPSDSGIHRYFHRLSFWEMHEYQALHQCISTGGQFSKTEDRCGLEHLERAGMIRKVRHPFRPGQFQWEVVAGWEGEPLRLLTERSEGLRIVKEGLLKAMIDYAEPGGGCLREQVVQYFQPDWEPTQNPRCCSSCPRGEV
jgi:ATP-dependent DNA helicase RecQ